MVDRGLQARLLSALRSGEDSVPALRAICRDLSGEGLDRLQLMAALWAVMTDSGASLSDDEMDVMGDFASALLGQGPFAHHVYLAGEPEDETMLMAHVARVARQWKPPS